MNGPASHVHTQRFISIKYERKCSKEGNAYIFKPSRAFPMGSALLVALLGYPEALAGGPFCLAPAQLQGLALHSAGMREPLLHPRRSSLLLGTRFLAALARNPPAGLAHAFNLIKKTPCRQALPAQMRSRDVKDRSYNGGAQALGDGGLAPQAGDETMNPVCPIGKYAGAHTEHPYTWGLRGRPLRPGSLYRPHPCLHGSQMPVRRAYCRDPSTHPSLRKHAKVIHHVHALCRLTLAIRDALGCPAFRGGGLLAAAILVHRKCG